MGVVLTLVDHDPWGKGIRHKIEKRLRHFGVGAAPPFLPR